MSVPLSEQYPDTTFEFAEEGTTAHEVAEYEVERLFGITRTEEAPVPLDEDMARHAVDYANYIHELTTSADDTILVEQKVKLFATIDQTALSTLCFGTADCLLLTDDETTLHVVDYKYGKGVEVIYADGEAQPRSAALEPQTAFVVYSDDASAQPLFGVHFHPVVDEGGRPRGYEAQVYTETECLSFRAADFASLLRGAPYARAPHYFGRVPLIEYWNNEEETGDVECVLSLIDAYDALQSDRVNDQEQLVDALLIVYGARLEADERGRTPGQQLRQDKLLYLPDREAGAR